MIAIPDGSQWNLLVPGERTQGRVAIVEILELEGEAPPRHVHSREDEFIWVIEGRVNFDIGDDRLDGPAGTCLFLPRGTEHTHSVVSPEARLLVLVSPAGLEECLRELSQPADRQDEQQVAERLVTTAARYGVSITGPGRTP